MPPEEDAAVTDAVRPDVTGMADNEFDSGVTSVGLFANTAAPVPVSSDNAPASCADVNEPRTAALPTEVTWPVRLALVVTVAALPVVFWLRVEIAPPRVNDPDEVTVPVSVSPLTVPAPETLVTVPTLTASV